MWRQSEELKLLQKAELDIFHEFKNICAENNLSFYLLGGTFLGAVRHKGFIPWDDDIDVGMPRKDFESFLNYMNTYSSDHFKLECFQRDYKIESYVPKMVNRNIKVIDCSAVIPCEQFAWIDIFPLDGMPANRFMLKIHSFRLLIARLRLNYSRFSRHVDMRRKARPLIERILIRLGYILPVEKIFKTRQELLRLDALLKKYDYDTSLFVINFMGIYKFREMFPKKIYDVSKEYSFEDMQVTAPKDYNLVLTQLYGDYMKFPDDDERNHHNIKFIK